MLIIPSEVKSRVSSFTRKTHRQRQQSYSRTKIQIPFFSYIVWIKNPTCATTATSVHRYAELNSHIYHRNTQVKSYLTSELRKSFTTQGRSCSLVLKTFFSLNQRSFVVEKVTVAGLLVQSHTRSLFSIQGFSLCKYSSARDQCFLWNSSLAADRQKQEKIRFILLGGSIKSLIHWIWCTAEESLAAAVSRTFRQIVIRLKSVQSISKYFNRLCTLFFFKML